MKEWMLVKLIPMAIGYLLNVAKSDKVKVLIDGVFDKIEDFVASSETEIDDVIVLPIITEFRRAFDIPDDD
jgi:hypothetical protein